MQSAGRMNMFILPRENVLPVPPTVSQQEALPVCALVMPGLVESMNLMSHCRVWVSAIDSASGDSHSEMCQAPLAMCNLALIYIIILALETNTRHYHNYLIFIHCSNFGLYNIVIYNYTYTTCNNANACSKHKCGCPFDVKPLVHF